MSAGLFYLRSPWVFGPGFRKPFSFCPALCFRLVFMCARNCFFPPNRKRELSAWTIWQRVDLAQNVLPNLQKFSQNLRSLLASNSVANVSISLGVAFFNWQRLVWCLGVSGSWYWQNPENFGEREPRAKNQEPRTQNPEVEGTWLSARN